MTLDPDLEIIRRLQAGDESALDEIMARYKRPILDFVYRMIGDATEAEDVAQEVFVRAWQKSKSFRPRALFSTWLFQIARNAALDRLRARKVPMIGNFDEESSNDWKNPATDFQSLELSEQIARAVAKLPEDQREVLILTEYEGRSYAEAAAITRCSERAIEGRLYRAKSFLRKALQHLM